MAVCLHVCRNVYTSCGLDASFLRCLHVIIAVLILVNLTRQIDEFLSGTRGSFVKPTAGISLYDSFCMNKADQLYKLY